MIEVGKYNRESTNTDLVVEGVVLEILSLNTLLKIFKNLYFHDCICRLQSQFKALRSGFRDFVIKFIIEDLSKFINSELND